MAKKSQATKAVLASLLATSAIVPAIAVNAEVGGETTRTTEATTTSAAATKMIEFTIEDPTGMLKNYIPTSGELMEHEGKKLIKIDIDAKYIDMFETITADGVTAIHNYGSKMVLIPVSDDFKPVAIAMTVNTPAGKRDLTTTLTPDAKSIKEVTAETKPAEEKPAVEEKIFAVGKTFESVADGTYDVKWDAYKEKVGNYTRITGQFAPEAKLIVKEGKYSVAISTTEASKSMIAGLKIAGKEGVEKDGVYTVEIPSISELHESSVHVVVPAMKMDTVYEFGFAIETADLELPKADATPTPAPAAKTEPVYVYKDGTKELSVMKTYVKDTVEVTTTETGSQIELTFTQGQYVDAFDVEGATVAKKSETEAGKNKVIVYTIDVKDVSKIYNATMTITVPEMPNYNKVPHVVQMQFGGKPAGETVTAVPFKDIEKNGNKDAIINLYNKGIFKAAENFNPADNLKRSQFALMLNRALKLDVPAKANFSDIEKYDAETKTAINALNGFGIINGKTATTFAPAQDVTRKQAALMIFRLLEKQGYQATGDTANFSDMPKDVEAAKAISALNKLGIISGFEGKFNPENKLTRSQMAKILNNTLTAVEGLKK